MENQTYKYIPKMPILASALNNFSNKKMSIAELVTKARHDNLRIIQKKEAKSLKQICLDKLANNIVPYISLIDKLSNSTKDILFRMMEISYNIELTFRNIDNEDYWQRACNIIFKKNLIIYDHGCSWKQTFAENMVENILINYDKNSLPEDTLFKNRDSPFKINNNDIKLYFDLFKNYVFNLVVKFFSADMNIEYITDYFSNIVNLEIKYSPILKGSTKNKYFESVESIKEEFHKFGMRIPSLKYFCLKIKDLNYLTSLTLQGNFVDEEMIMWLSSGLISNSTISYLNLSNNQINCKGCVNLCSFLLRTKTLLYLDLSNNNIGEEGGFALSLIIKENTNLNSINLALNKIDDINCAKIIKSLSSNSNLKILDLSTNNIGELSSLAFEYILSYNKTINELYLYNSYFSMDEDTIILLKNQPSVVKLDINNTNVSQVNKQNIEKILIKKEVNLKKNRIEL